MQQPALPELPAQEPVATLPVGRGRVGRRRQNGVRERPGGAALALIMALWVLILFDPHWWLASLGLGPLLKTRVILLAILMGTLALGVPGTPAWTRRWSWHAPMLAFIGVGLVTLPWALNNGMAREGIQELFLYWIFLVGTIAIVDSARRAERIVLMYGVSFAWWGVWGAPFGLVRWHHVLSNHDGYGAYMALGLGLTSFLVLATPKSLVRKALIGAALLCIVGVVSSFARGAFLASIAVYLTVFARSPKKGKTAGAGILGVAVLLAAASVLHPGEFWAEITSVFSQGTDEGTGEDRWELWKAATKVWMDRPIFGTGPNNWGVHAATYFEPGDVGGRYANNPGTLYNRSLHSFYFDILSELGIVGIGVFIWILRDFWKRNAALRKAEAIQAWRTLGGQLDLRALALGLEVAMVGFLTVAAFYSTAGKHWFWTIQGLNLLIHLLVSRHLAEVRRAQKRAALARVPSGDRL